MRTADEEAMLRIVLEHAGDNEDMIRDGIIKALSEVNDPARRQHLWCILPNAAKTRIRRERKKVLQRHLAGV